MNTQTKSKCCNADYLFAHTNEGRGYFQCQSCFNECGTANTPEKTPWQAILLASACPHCGADINQQYVDDVFRRVAKEAYKKGYIDGGIAEIEANATADITIAQEKVEQIRAQERDKAFIALLDWAKNEHSVSYGETAKTYERVIDHVYQLTK